jgi:hypothetical protein
VAPGEKELSRTEKYKHTPETEKELLLHQLTA